MRSKLNRLIVREEGSVLPLFALTFFVLFTVVDVAMGYRQAQMAQSRLHAVLDAAGLAAAAVSQSHKRDPLLEVQTFMQANLPDGSMGMHYTVSILNPDSYFDPATHTYTYKLQAVGKVSVPFMKIFGKETLDISAISNVTQDQPGLELVLVMDNTGSMKDDAGGKTKIQAAKDAATTLVNSLFGGVNQQTAQNLWIGLVPFAQAVNIGLDHASWVKADSYDWGPALLGYHWNGCVDAREKGGNDITDAPPVIDNTQPDKYTWLFDKYYWKCDGQTNTTQDKNAWFGTDANHSNCSIGKGMGYRLALDATRGPNKYCSQALTGMTSHKQLIMDGIQAMQPRGYTHIVMGAVWGWRMLSPKWRGMWGGQMDASGLPLGYDTPHMNKAMIIMSDGDNTIPDDAHTAYGYLSEGKLGSTTAKSARQEVDNRTSHVCTNIKSGNHITVYTIAFGVDISNTGKKVLKDCASKPEYYFESPTAADLETAFSKIADSLMNLRLSR